MSRAYKTNTRAIRKRQKRIRTPEETRFLSFFGATDLNNSLAEGLTMLPAHNQEMEFKALTDIPLPMDEPLSMDEIPLTSMPATMENQLFSKEPTALAFPGYLVPAIESQAALNEDDQDIERSDSEVLVEFLEEMGQRVQEVKALPAGIRKITVADLMGTQKTREPELVMAGGR